MTSFYQQPHIFVVFRPGAAGNFISNLIDNILNQNLEGLKISNSGHVHYNSIVERKRSDKDFLSFGSGLMGTDLGFFSEEEKIEYFKRNIDNSDYTNRPYVTWTHAFNNIPIYRELFPNSKILVINDHTIGERLTALIMHVNKNHFSNDDQSPFPKKDRIKPKIFKVMAVKENFYKSYPDKKYQSGHLYLDMSLLYKSFLYIQGLDPYLSEDLTTKIQYHDNNSNTTLNFIEKKAQFSIGIEYADLANTSIDFSDIMNKSSAKIIQAFELILERSLSNSESQYVTQLLSDYVASQDQQIISDPVGYLKEVKEKADTIVSAF